ncbi:MAG: hypothetical protein JNM95_00060 [Chitinophagaceae bacterium]|nr:hypothetical protein [Chitinophagaceae bacterium]
MICFPFLSVLNRSWYLLALFTFLSGMYSSAQHTIAIPCIGSAGSFKSGSVNNLGVKNDGHLVSLNNTSNRGWATFNLSSLVGKTIIAASVEFTTYSSNSSSAGNWIKGFIGNPATLSGTALYDSCFTGSTFHFSTWETNDTQTETLNSDGVNFMQANVGGSVNLGFVRNSVANFNIYGYSGSTPPKLIITYYEGGTCTGIPAPGNTLTTSATVCASEPFLLSLENPTLANGISYQWKRADDSLFTTNVLNLGTDSVQTSVQTSNATKYYRCHVTCSNGNLIGKSVPVKVTSNSNYCLSYCSSGAANTGTGTDIFNFSVAGMSNSSDCSSTGTGPGSVNGSYANYKSGTGAPIVPFLTRSQVIPIAYTINFCYSTQPTSVTSVYIDFNQNGIFTDAGEHVFNKTQYYYDYYQSGTITIPATASLGTTVMRVVNIQDETVAWPCNNYYYGETEDYYVQIVDNPNCNGIPSALGNTLSNYTNVCPNSVITLSVQNTPTTPGLTFQWYNSAGIVTGATGTTLTTTISTSTNFYCKVTCTNSLQSVTSIPIAINMYPNVTLNTSVTPSGAVCEGIALTLNATGASTYMWQPGNLGGGTVVVNASSTTYTVTGVSAQGCIGTATRVITITPNTGSTVTNDSICEGSSTTIIASGATTYSLNPGGLAGSSFTVTPSTTTTYTITGTNAAGCTKTATQTVYVIPAPVQGTSTASPTAICLGSNIGLSYTSPIAYNCAGASTNFQGYYAPSNWTFTKSSTSNGSLDTSLAPNSIKLASSNASFFTWSPANTIYGIVIPCTGVITFNWSYFNYDNIVGNDRPLYYINSGAANFFPGYNPNGASTQSGVASIAVNAGDLFRFDAWSATNSGGWCEITISNISLPTLSLVSQSVSWFNTASGGTSLGNGFTQNHTPTTSGALTYYAQVTDNVTGCTNPLRVASNVVNVNMPVVTTTVTSSAICIGGSTSIIPAGASSYTLNPGALSGSSFTVSPSATTTYTITGTSAQGCISSTTRTITVNALPALTTSATSSSVCVGNSVTLVAANANTYSWNPGALNGASITVSPLATTTYTVTGTNTNGCSSTATRTITVNPLPNVTTASSLTTLCAGASTTITASNATTYAWNPGGLSGPSITVNPLSTTTYTVTGSNASTGCTKTATRIITVNPLPTISTNATSGTICMSGSTTLSATNSNTYIWNPGNLSGATITTNPTVTTTYTVTGTNTTTGCNGTATRVITVLDNNTSSINVSIPCTGISGSYHSGSVSSSGAKNDGDMLTLNNAANRGWSSFDLTDIPQGAIITSATVSFTTYGSNGSTAGNWIKGFLGDPAAINGTALYDSCFAGPTFHFSSWLSNGIQTESFNASGIAFIQNNIGGNINLGYVRNSGVSYNIFGYGSATPPSLQITYSSPCVSTTLNLHVLLEGYWDGNGGMLPVLLNQGQPNTLNDCDSLGIELHEANSPFNVLFTKNALLHTNGQALVQFDNAITGSYYLVVKSRNGLETWSANPITFTAGTMTYDFTDDANKAYSSNQTLVAPGTWAMYSGDINQDGAIDGFDYLFIEPDIILGNSGYLNSDLNGDGVVDAYDFLVLDPNITEGISASTP